MKISLTIDVFECISFVRFFNSLSRKRTHSLFRVFNQFSMPMLYCIGIKFISLFFKQPKQQLEKLPPLNILLLLPFQFLLFRQFAPKSSRKLSVTLLTASPTLDVEKFALICHKLSLAIVAAKMISTVKLA